ncbi:hypothetical protein FVEN_g1124 [Fusarium venenatum]|uniref:Uncharacterized protein n=1 Tax=Fusarium venenatum TaxID=56646 RepID=A0A2L2TWL2_9HYPO|nr:uncharacterized protein FVRRES_10444 [Fusarium venenatum]KAG8361110.1 hypothetical protein FVEN_g1124 [Fusarium venenatum]KAH6967048.1 hypothetical protein EDB82DRAFT_353199 [Fusarium venenatum]CEI70367.1 unnamed protein product [Fusarium venenatum]
MPSAPGSPGGNVMTQAQLETYQKQKAQERSERQASDSEDEDDNINYDSDDDKVAKPNDQRRRQEAHLATYRQKMMKTTTGQPAVEHTRIPSLKGPWMDITDSDDDDDIPLAMLKSKAKGDQASRLSGVRSNPNLRASSQQYLMRPGSSQGQNNGGSHLRLPSFASNLPQDPFADPYQDPFNEKKPMFNGGLIGVIAQEERAKASRRGGTPSVSLTGPPDTGFGMSNGSIYGMQQASRSQSSLSGMPNPYMASPYGMHQASASQTSLSGMPMQHHMQHQVPHGIQEQMQFMQTAIYGAQHKPKTSWGSIPQRPGTSGSMAAMQKPSLPAYGGYAQSIPPAERSNVGLPSRYRAVSKLKA